MLDLSQMALTRSMSSSASGPANRFDSGLNSSLCSLAADAAYGGTHVHWSQAERLRIFCVGTAQYSACKVARLSESVKIASVGRVGEAAIVLR